MGAVVIENFNENIIMEKTIIGILFITVFANLINGHTLAYVGHAHEGPAHEGHAHIGPAHAEGQAHTGQAHEGLTHEGHAHEGHAYAIRKRQAEIPIQISGRLDVSIGTQCVLNGRTFKSGTSILDGCTDCKCNNGLVACRFLRSITDGCLYYEDSESTTPPPNGCKFENIYRYDGEVFTAQDGCNRCWCNKSEIICPFESDCENAVARRRSLK